MMEVQHEHQTFIQIAYNIIKSGETREKSTNVSSCSYENWARMRIQNANDPYDVML